jgi:ribose 5-phosphate isomerase B
MIGIGSDHNGFELKCRLRAHLAGRGDGIRDSGCFGLDPVDYPDTAAAVASAAHAGSIQRGIFVCGSGPGMAIAANEFAGVYAVPVTDARTAHLARERNDAQIITPGATVIGPELACEIVDAWLRAEFRGGDSARKIAKILAPEQRRWGAAELVAGGTLW